MLLLERRTKEECMQGGTALGLWTNAFRALDALGGGVTAAVRERSSRTTAVEICREKSDRVLTRFDLTSCEGGPHEFGGVLRGELVGALYDAVDAGCVDVRFGTAVASVRGGGGSGDENETTVTVTTDAGEGVTANVVGGGHGGNTVVGRAYGAANDKDMSTNDAGQVAIRGIAAFPAGDEFPAGGPIRQVLGAGVRAGMYPVGPAERNELYWYVCYPSGSSREGSDVLEEARRVLLESNEDWRTSRIFDAIARTDPSRVSRNRLADRWDVDALFSFSSGGSVSIALTGDALHPMTPNLGQGGCCALEDAVLLAAYLPGPEAKGAAVRQAIAAYTAKRARRCVKLTVRARAMGEILQSGVGAVVLARDLFLERGFRAGGFLDHAAYDVRKDARGEGGEV